MIEYKFRAETPYDVVRLCKILPIRVGYLTQLSTRKVYGFLESEAVVTMVDKTALEDVRNFMRRVLDGHMMVQTVQPIYTYTGVRDMSVPY